MDTIKPESEEGPWQRFDPEKLKREAELKGACRLRAHETQAQLLGIMLHAYSLLYILLVFFASMPIHPQPCYVSP
jgi:hypothetical protein